MFPLKKPNSALRKIAKVRLSNLSYWWGFGSLAGKNKNFYGSPILNFLVSITPFFLLDFLGSELTYRLATGLNLCLLGGILILGLILLFRRSCLRLKDNYGFHGPRHNFYLFK